MTTESPKLLFDDMLNASNEVDFQNINDIIGYASLILSAADEIEIKQKKVDRHSAEALKITQLAKDWVYNVKKHLPGMSVGETMDILVLYDLIHRLGYRSPLPKSLEDEYIFKALDSYIHGDKSVNKYHLYRAIRRHIGINDKSYLGQPLKWYSASLDYWHEKFRYGYSFESLSDYDTLQMISILLSENLFGFVDGNSSQYKKKLYDNHRHYFSRIANYGVQELNALSYYLSCSASFMPNNIFREYDNAIMRARLEHPDTNRFYRIALCKNTYFK